jgi:hypothetical protein
MDNSFKSQKTTMTPCTWGGLFSYSGITGDFNGHEKGAYFSEAYMDLQKGSIRLIYRADEDDEDEDEDGEEEDGNERENRETPEYLLESN